jgi:hypothetical protein
MNRQSTLPSATALLQSVGLERSKPEGAVQLTGVLATCCCGQLDGC